LNKHHIIPRSRKRNSKKTVSLPKGFHKALHEVFGNLYDSEMLWFIYKLNCLFKSNSEITGKELEKIRTDIKAKRY
jgi:hypothetical protein